LKALVKKNREAGLDPLTVDDVITAANCRRANHVYEALQAAFASSDYPDDAAVQELRQKIREALELLQSDADDAAVLQTSQQPTTKEISQ
jgi:hypothetical protein